jgi:hypothetical protein
MKLTKKVTLLVLITAFLVLLLVLVPAFAAGKGKNKDKPPGKADGIWCYMPDLEKVEPVIFYNSYPDDPIMDYGEPNKMIMKVPYTAEWTGTFSGSSREYGIGIFQDVGPMVFLDSILFDEVEVDGKTGSLYMDAFGNREYDGADWEGTWVITAGTGELENLRGHGIFWGPGWQWDPEACGIIYYKVKALEFEDDVE